MRHFALIVLLLLANAAQAGLYRWVDDAGEVHYSDVVPATVEKNGHSELNAQGMTLKTVPAAPTEAEIAASKRRETLAQLRNALDNRQQEQDNHLPANYTDIAELEAVFQSKLTVLAKNTQSIAERRDSLASKLAAVKAQASHIESTAQREKLNGYVLEAEQTLTTYDYALQDNQTEQDSLRQRYEKDRERLSKLLNASPSSPHPDPSTAPAILRVALDRQ
jgi:chromosome segregation ATPase